MNQLFDKQIEIELYDSIDGKGAPSDKIVIPPTGVKPNIGLTASFTTAEVMGQVALRITNFYPSKALSDYQYMKITAGYRDSPDKTTLEGRIWIATQESPSPDGVTMFSWSTGNYEDLLNSVQQFYIPKGAPLSSLFTDITTALKSNTGSNWTLDYTYDAVNIVAGLSYQGTMKDLLAQIKTQFQNLQYIIEGSKLVVWNYENGRSKDPPIEINYVSSPPQATAAGFTFVAPWIPKLRPGMLVKIDPRYYKQTFSGKFVDLPSVLKCQSVQLEFNTVTSQNQMTVLALNTAPQE